MDTPLIDFFSSGGRKKQGMAGRLADNTRNHAGLLGRINPTQKKSYFALLLYSTFLEFVTCVI
jgi:hypothetical protein